MDPALIPAAVDDLALDGFDRDRIVVDVERAGGFARRGANAAGELREVVRLEQAVQRLLPPVLVNQVVPVRDQVAQRAGAVAERQASVHAAGALASCLFF